MKKQIVILGGGFAGVYTYLSLMRNAATKNFDVLIINNTNHFLFTPMLHEVATGSLAEHQIVESLRSIMQKRGGEVLVADVLDVNLDRKKISTPEGDVGYDVLVVALGATTQFYGVTGAAEHSYVLKTLQDAARLKGKFIECFDAAINIKDVEERKKLLTFSVIGGGPTGVELVAEMADLFFETLIPLYGDKIHKNEITLTLINRGKEILHMFDESLRTSALAVLRKKGVKVLLDVVVKEVTAAEVVLEDGTKIPSMHTMWAAGVSPTSIKIDPEVERDRSGRILIDSHLRIKGHTDVFALGDIAAQQNTHGDALPMLAQVAVQQGKAAGKNIAAFLSGKQPTPFVYRSKGSLVSLGQWHAVGKTFGILWKGPLAWFAWRTVYLFNFASWPNRIRIALDWTLNLFNPRDITRA